MLNNQANKLYLSLQKRYKKKITLGTNRIKEALRRLNNPHLLIKSPCNIIGSDGKFFLIQALKSFIEENNQKVSAFVSPHLKTVLERFWLKDHFITFNELKKNIKIIQRLNVKLTLFECLNLAYYISASKLKNVDYSLNESGLLFAGDSTRVFDNPTFQIITNINEQHLEWCHPPTLQEVCRQKVGFLSKKTTIYVGKQNSKTMKIIKKILKTNPSKKIFYGRDWTIKKKKNKRIYEDKMGKIILNYPSIISEAMFENLGLSIKVARDLNISKSKILKAIPKINYEGRYQWITKGKLRNHLKPQEKLLLNGCHGIASAIEFSKTLKKMKEPLYAIISIQKNREPKKFISCFEDFKKVVCIKVPNEENFCDAEELKKIAKSSGFESIAANGIKDALSKISSHESKTVVLMGSLYTVGTALNLNS